MNEKIKRIGITLRIETIEKYDEKRDAISHDWTKFLQDSDALPIFIPNTLTDTKYFLEKMKLDGLILSGGDNKGDDIERDKTEQEIIELSVKNKIPLLGICRGMQVINDFFGGEIIATNNLNHVAKHHEIQLVDDNFQKFFQSEKIEVNSFHNNIIKNETIGNDLQVFAVSENDQTVEGFYHKDLPIIGVMWHPERDKNVQNQSQLMKIFFEKLYWSD